MKWLYATLLTTAAAFAAVQNAPLPDGEGKAEINAACVSCHGADLITARQASKEEWQGIIDRMKSYGTAIDDKQSAVILDYLVKNFGPKDAKPGDAPATATADAGKATMENYCGFCHDLDLVSGRTGTQAEWQEIVDRMQARGSGVPDNEIAGLVQYLTKTYGRPAQND